MPAVRPVFVTLLRCNRALLGDHYSHTANWACLSTPSAMLTGQVLLTAGLSARIVERGVTRTKLGTILDNAPLLLGKTRGGVLNQDNIIAQ